MPVSVAVLLAAGWCAWWIPFFLVKRGPSAQTIDRRARWGIVLEAVGFAFVWARPLWVAGHPAWRVVGGAMAFALGALLSWTSARTLGRQWRFDAGLNADHRLVRSGAYRFVRHPIYTSMLCMLVGTGLLLTRLALLPVGIAFFLAGTEIRVRIEDRLLASRFGADFEAYRRGVPAYLPFLRRPR
ncbi:MAG: methyltransferase family protein [Vicinamibacterales bacterium]